MSVTTVFGPVHSDEGRRWTVSVIVAVVLHIAGAALILHLYAASMLAPQPASPAMTFIELQPLPTPPAPTVAPPPEPVTPPEPQQRREVQPPVAKPIVPLKPVVQHHAAPKVTAPTPTVEPTTQAAVPSPAAPPAPAAPTVDHAVPRFTDLIAAQIERYKRYPAVAQKRGDQGVVLVRFTLDRGGNVSNARIERSSGHGDLDDEVMALLRRAAPFPAMPADITASTLDIVVPVSFALH